MRNILPVSHTQHQYTPHPGPRCFFPVFILATLAWLSVRVSAAAVRRGAMLWAEPFLSATDHFYERAWPGELSRPDTARLGSARTGLSCRISLQHAGEWPAMQAQGSAAPTRHNPKKKGTEMQKNKENGNSTANEGAAFESVQHLH